jgi:tripartite-type tricarboxylate transporter receptor subunit TctC
MRTRPRPTTVAALALACAMLGATAGHAQGFYDGKTVTMIVPHSASGGYARYSQLLAPHLEAALKADDLRIEHHSGAGGILGSNLVWHSEPDGLTFGFSSGTSLMLASLAGGEGVQFDATEFTYLGRPTADDRIIFVGADSPIQSWQDVIDLDRPFRVPSQGVDDDFYTMAMLADTFGFDVEFITGYEGGADTTLAVIKGDGDGRLTSWPSATPMLQAGDIRPILTIGEARNPEYPDVPTALELVSDPEKQKLVKALMNIQSLHRSFFGPPGIPAEVAEEMRAAIMAVVNDPAVIEEAKAKDLPLNPMPGAQQQEMVVEIYEASSEIPPILDAAVQSIQ